MLIQISRPIVSVAFLIFGVPLVASIFQPPYPFTPTVDVVHEYHGIKLRDPFVWLEDHRTQEAEQWFREQDAFARATLARIPVRSELLERITEIDEAKTEQVFAFQRAGERYFYQKQEIGEDVARLYYRDGLDGPEIHLADPAAFAVSDSVYAIQWFRSSPCGEKVALAVAAGGSEIPSVHVLEVSTGLTIGAPIPRVRSSASWLEDSSGFFYRQLRPEVQGEERVLRFQRQPVRFHRLGEDPAQDPVFFSYDTHPGLGLSPVDSASIIPVHGSDWTIMFVSHGVDRANTIFYTKTESLWQDSIPWQKLCGRADLIETISIQGDTVFLLSAKNAPKKKILQANLRTFANSPEFSVILPESEMVITALSVVGGRLFVSFMDGGIDRLFVLTFTEEENVKTEILLPLIGRVTFLGNDPFQPEFFLSLTSWSRAPAYYRWDPETGQVFRIPLRPLGPYDAPENLVVKRVLFRSHDGVRVPLTIIYQEGLELDGRNPVLLHGYGAYGIPQRPGFNPLRLAWLERGGIYAVAHVRGGGEFGREWHKAGHLERKRNSWLDFNAAADFLIEAGYTSKGRIAASGGSMGGVLVGRAMTSRPELFGAIVSNVGNHNPVRNHRRPNGPANYPEYGNPLDPEEFPYVLAMDSYHAVRDGVRYPPMLLTAGFNDARVDPWMPGKKAARLQQNDPEGGPFLLRIEFRAGHYGVSRADIREEMADTFAFLFWALGRS